MIHTLEMPWGFTYPKVQYWKEQKVHVYKGAILPEVLRPFASKDFSYSRWKEDELNGLVIPHITESVTFKPEDHQKAAAKKIFKSFINGWPGFLEMDKTGVGKTLSSLSGLALITKNEGYTPRNKAKLLIVCPAGAIPHWRHTLQSYPIITSMCRPLIMSYGQLNKLLEAPSNAKVSKKRRTKNRLIASKGKPNINWDFIIFDESQYLKNYGKSTMSLSAESVAQLNKPYIKNKTPFVIYSTATPGATPLNFSIMANIIARLINNTEKSKKITPAKFGQFLFDEGFDVTKGKSGWNWSLIPYWGAKSIDPKEKAKHELAVRKAKLNQKKDTIRIGKALTNPGAPFIMRKPKDIAGWPEQQTVPLPIELTSKQIPIYKEVWTRFRNWLNLTPAKSDPKGALVETLRYRQKSSLLKVESLVEPIVDFVESGNQVYVSCEFLETLDTLKEALEKKKLKVCEISGRNASEREDVRIAFQKGEYDVVLCTVVAAISLHEGESLPGGIKASNNPRITIILDIRQNNLDTEQALGRAHRQGTNSIAYFPYLIDTVDEKIIDRYITKTNNMNSMLGDNKTTQLEDIFRNAAAVTTKPNKLS